ncbi:MAG: GntR family transcriptional regulator [Candidatus Binatia bacterium]
MPLAKRPVSPFPLYFRVMMEIRENILSGKWSPGFQIPGELELGRRLGVSVITIRQALGQLAEEGYLRRERAKGTFVNWTSPSRQSINLELEAEDLVTLNRYGTSFKLIAIEPIEPSKQIKQEFRIAASEKVMRIIRLRMSHGQPLAYVVSYVPSRIASRISEKRIARQPLSSTIETALRIRITGVKHVVAARLSDDDVSAHLEIPAGSPVLYVERDYTHKKDMVLRTIGYYRSDLFSYELKLKRKS